MREIQVMARKALTDTLWDQLQSTMIKYGCYQTQNSREIMEAILWKLRTGAPWRDIPKELCSWKTAYSRFNRWSKTGLWADFFLAYAKKLIRNGYSQTEAMFAVTSMQVELGVVKIEQLDEAVAAQLQRYTYPVMPMDIRSILKSLGVTSTTVKLQVN
jgi:transposase